MRPLGEILCDIAQNKNISQAELDYLKGLINNIEMNASMTQGWVDGSTTQISRASVLAGSGNSLLDDQGLRIYNGPTLTGWWEIDGTLRTGSNLAAANTTSFAVFPNLTTYNGESMPIGTVLMGSNSSGYSNIRYDPSTGQLEFRGGTTVQAYVDTDGTIVFGGGAGKLSTDGITLINNTGVYASTATYKISDATNDLVQLYAYNTTFGGIPGVQSVLQIPEVAGREGHLNIWSYADSDHASSVQLLTGHYLSPNWYSATINLSCATHADSDVASIYLRAGNITTGAEYYLHILPAGINLSPNSSTVSTQTINEFSTDTTMAGDSDTALPTEHATKTYVDTAIAGVGGGSGNLSLSWLV